MDEFTPTEMVRGLTDKLRACYVFPEVAEQICRCLQEHLEAGDYADIVDGELLALALTLHLQETHRDEHLWVKWHKDPLPDNEEQLRLDADWQKERRLEATLDNYGLHRVERLPGNIGYLDIRYFHRPEWGGPTVVAAMNFLADTSALIIDLRQCPGGYPGMIALVCSYFFEEKSIHLGSIYWRDDDTTQQYWSQPFLPGRRFGAKPVYVLTSKATFSGGESFADILQSRRRATLIGEKTDGGAHPSTSYRLHPHFEVSIPIGRTINPITGTDWEGIGITPDIPIPSEYAFKAAYQKALQSVLDSLGEPHAGPLQALREEAHTALKGLAAA